MMFKFIKLNTLSQKYHSLPMAESESDNHGHRSSDESDLPLMKELSCHKNESRTLGFFGNMKSAMKNPMFIVSFLFFQIGVGSLFLAWHHSHRFNARFKDISMHSPLLDRIQIPLVPRKSYAQYGMGGPEIWRAEPSEEVDKAWERVTAEYLFPVKESDIKAMRKDPSVVVPMPENHKIDGETTYMAKSAVYHNIHCLDYIRKAVYHDHYYPNGTDDNPFHAYHTAHCIMILFEHLTCSGDPGVYLFRWMEEFNRPIADTNIWRQCWDFETVMEEHNEKAVKDMTETDVRKPHGVKSVPAPDGVMNIIRNYQRTHPDYDPGQ
ncbi:Putative mycotoxin biosynthesis protein UstYa [Colletotrichum destructivum]|uniref:Mycotoxin biosynthesis protein UstYa n=1 Tax=Colletotrichum destructivum TaxID=34406 RepID=A0AAX4J539_9PEZI|nr:Putative mycotoxin biosynthesis protein UstYa [Colletotrichum destructivum]